MKWDRIFCVAWLALACLAVQAHADESSQVFARLIWQDTDTQTLRWGDVTHGGTWNLQAADVEGFPKLDPEKQAFVQMRAIDGVVLTGVHDTDHGNFQSGWVALDARVTSAVRGSRVVGCYDQPPVVVAQRLDEQQGNPAHVYEYAGAFYLANDQRNGFTQVIPAELRARSAVPADRFFSAGGGHITLAVVDGQVAYATWIDREGPNQGRVDVLGLGSSTGKRYHFQLSSGGIHGATTNSGKVFFAPSDGLAWVAADRRLERKPEQISVHHLSLGEDANGNPLRTGAFVNSNSYVVFTVGRGEQAQLCWLDAASPKPSVQQMPLEITSGNSLTSPVVIQSAAGEPFALLFEENADGEQTEQLHVISLDPNRDGDYQDASWQTSLPVGASRIRGHSGHHEVTRVGAAHVAISNPGDGTLCLVAIRNWQPLATWAVGGAPTRLVAIGAGD